MGLARFVVYAGLLPNQSITFPPLSGSPSRSELPRSQPHEIYQASFRGHWVELEHNGDRHSDPPGLSQDLLTCSPPAPQMTKGGRYQMWSNYSKLCTSVWLRALDPHASNSLLVLLFTVTPIRTICMNVASAPGCHAKDPETESFSEGW
jgi:hypothetical protein